MNRIVRTLVTALVSAAAVSVAAPALATDTPAPSTTRTVASAAVVGTDGLTPESGLQVTLDNGRTKTVARCEASSDRRCWMFVANVPYVSVHFGSVVGWVRVPVAYDGHRITVS